jgi:multiple sugar transport system permease protein
MTTFFKRFQPQLHIPLLIAAVFFLGPLVWMLATSLKSPDDIIKGLGALQWIPRPFTMENYRTVVERAESYPIYLWTRNSVFISAMVTLLVLIVDTFAAFAYSRLKWKGRDTLFSLLVATMLVPGQVLLIPSYLLIRNLNWFDTYLALTVPAGAGAFGVFLLRQFFVAIPNELEDAARMDGCGPMGILRHVIVPLAKPALAALAIFTFMGSWNAFEAPLIFTDSVQMRTLPIGITIFQGRYNTEYGPMMAAATLAAIPVATAFLLFQRQIIKGISLTGLAGR